MDSFELELKQDFLIEAQQGLEQAEQYFLSLESDPENIETLNHIFRLAHNLKGTARAVGFGPIAEFTHKMENLILQLKEKSIPTTDTVIEILLACNDRIKEMIALLTQDFEAVFENTDLESRIQFAIENNGLAQISPESEDITFPEESQPQDAVPEASLFDESNDFSDSINEESNTIEPNLELLKELQEKLSLEAETKTGLESDPSVAASADSVEKAALENKPVISPIATAESGEKQSSGHSQQQKIEESIRVSIPRIEKLNNLVGELVILQSVLRQSNGSQDSTSMSKSLDQLKKLTKEIHEMSMSLRMIPLKPTIMKMQRIVRDTSKALNKNVELVISGENTEVDKTIVEYLNEPLVHVVRNAIDHGIEDSQERLSSGKNETATVTIACYHEGNNIVIAVRDDGRGINPKKIQEIAIKKKVLSPNQQLSDQDLIQLIFHPGFSTKSEVSEVSGRGVGMDVVKTNIQKMNGEVIVNSVVGIGSEFKIMLPLTTAVIDGMVACVGKNRFVLPIDQIHETLSIEPGSINQNSATGEVFNLRGETIPLFRSRSVLGLPPAETDADEKIAVITKRAGLTFALTVDDILAQQQVVIKQLGQEVKSKNQYMGSSILGDGMPSLILDLHKIGELKVAAVKPGIEKQRETA